MNTSTVVKKQKKKPIDIKIPVDTKKKPVKKSVKDQPVKEPKEPAPKVKEPILSESTVEESTLDTTLTETINTTDESVITQPQSEDKKDPISDILNSLLNKYEILEKDSRNNKHELKKVIKLYQKKSFKHKRKNNPNRTPSGFAKPSVITDELCKFLDKPVGTKMARTDVTREVNNYIKKHNLQNPDNKKKITPDETLRALLKIKVDDNTLTYFSMQKYLKDHFPKEDTSVVS